MLPFVRPYHEVDRDEELELANLNESADESPQGTALRSIKDKWHLPPWEEILNTPQQRNCQILLWVVSAVVLLTAGLWLAILRPASHTRPSSTGQTSSAANAGEPELPPYTATAKPFPSGPWLEPTGLCVTSTSSLGPATNVHSPLGYRVYLSFLEHHFAASVQRGATAAAGFTAATNITLAIHQETACVRLHASNLTFSTISARVLTGADVQQQAAVCLCGHESGCLVVDCGRLFKRHPDSDSWLMSLGNRTAPAGSTLLISVLYTAYFGSSGVGVWRSSPFNTTASDGTLQQQVLISSQLEAKGARRVFPCMDEPKYKAPIVVLVEGPSRLSILSNMPEAQRSVTHSGRVLVQFLPTPPMSTYLMAIVVGDMQAATANTTKGPKIRLWLPRNQLIPSEATAVPLQLAVAAFDHYASYTRVAQPLTKFDLVAVPGKSSAMENWGLLIFDAERLLYSLPSAWSLFRCASVICHEVAHQWFGNLVTAVRWSDLLVNEGVASLLEYGCMAQVLPEFLGTAGAAALMRQALTFHGRIPGVHEGVYDKALTYDSLPTASPLVGAHSGVDADVDFGVLVYSKAASVLAMWTQYAATGSASMTSFSPAMSLGPVSQLVNSSPAQEMQTALQQFLRQHIYGSADAQQVLQLFLSKTPDELSSNTEAVLTGLRAPGSPLMVVKQQQQGQVSVVGGRRFCQWGVLDDSLLNQMLAGTASMSAAAAAAGDSTVLVCPLQVDDIDDRAVPWTPVFLSHLTSSRSDAADIHMTNSSGVGSTDETQDSEGSSIDRSTGSGPLCGVWHVVKQDNQQLKLPTETACLPPDAAAAAGSSTSVPPLLVLEGDGGWGLYRSVYGPEQRAAARNWVSSQLVQQLRQQTQQQEGEGAGSSTDASVDSLHLDLCLLFTASRLLADQAVVALSPFGDVAGWEVKAAVQAAVDAAAAAARAREAESGTILFGHVLYTLLAPLLQTYEAAVGRVVRHTSCWKSLQADLSAVLTPVIDAAFDVFACCSPDSDASAGDGDNDTSPLQHYPSSGHFLGAMSLNTLITATALMDRSTASKVCRMFNTAIAGIEVQSGGGIGAASASVVMSQLPHDLQAAVLAVAANRPEGCQLKMTADEVDRLLKTLYLTSHDPAVCTTAAFALAHSSNTAATADSSGPAWQISLSLLLGIEHKLPSDHGDLAKKAATPTADQDQDLVPACGVTAATHAVEVAKLMSRAVTGSTAQQASDKQAPSDEGGGELSWHQVGPVLDYVMNYWSSLVSSLGLKVAWQLVEEVTAQEVVTWQQWQKLADWVVSQHKQQQQQQSDEHALKQQRQWMRGVLGSAWSTVVWVSNNQHSLCSR